MNPIAEYLASVRNAEGHRPSVLSSLTEVSACLYRGYLPEVSTALYTVRQNTRIVIKEISICNATAGALTFSLRAVPPNSIDSEEFAIYDTYPLTMRQSDTFERWTFLLPGETLYGFASGPGVSCRISALEINPL